MYMRKFLSFLSLALLMALSGCEKSSVEDPRPLFDDSYPSFEQVVKADFAYLQSLPGDGQSYFYETECVLSGAISEMEAEDVRILSSTTIGSRSKVVYFLETDFTTGIREESSTPGAWAGTFSIDDPTVMPIGFSEAVGILLSQTQVPVPASDKMTFRKPMGTLPNPLYIFGSNHSFYVGVDGVTGEVYALSNVSELNGSLEQDAE